MLGAAGPDSPTLALHSYAAEQTGRFHAGNMSLKPQWTNCLCGLCRTGSRESCLVPDKAVANFQNPLVSTGDTLPP